MTEDDGDDEGGEDDEMDARPSKEQFRSLMDDNARTSVRSPIGGDLNVVSKNPTPPIALPSNEKEGKNSTPSSALPGCEEEGKVVRPSLVDSEGATLYKRQQIRSRGGW